MSLSASHIPAVSQRSMSSSMSPDRGDGGTGALTSDGEDKAGSSGPDLSILQTLADKRTTRGKDISILDCKLSVQQLIPGIRGKSAKEAWS